MLQSGAALVLDGIAGSSGYAIGRVIIVDTRRSGIGTDSAVTGERMAIHNLREDWQ